jgi:hypothetical protein
MRFSDGAVCIGVCHSLAAFVDSITLRIESAGDETKLKVLDNQAIKFLRTEKYIRLTRKKEMSAKASIYSFQPLHGGERRRQVVTSRSASR